jgi:hypothetical protein
MDMYRHANLRLPCTICGRVEATTRMALSPQGGHWCWTCQLAAQIAEHAPPAQLATIRRQLLPIMAIAAIVMVTICVAGYGLFWMIAMLHFC